MVAGGSALISETELSLSPHELASRPRNERRTATGLTVVLLVAGAAVIVANAGGGRLLGYSIVGTVLINAAIRLAIGARPKIDALAREIGDESGRITVHLSLWSDEIIVRDAVSTTRWSFRELRSCDLTDGILTMRTASRVGRMPLYGADPGFLSHLEIVLTQHGYDVRGDGPRPLGDDPFAPSGTSRRRLVVLVGLLAGALAVSQILVATSEDEPLPNLQQSCPTLTSVVRSDGSLFYVCG